MKNKQSYRGVLAPGKYWVLKESYFCLSRYDIYAERYRLKQRCKAQIVRRWCRVGNPADSPFERGRVSERVKEMVCKTITRRNSAGSNPASPTKEKEMGGEGNEKRILH